MPVKLISWNAGGLGPVKNFLKQLLLAQIIIFQETFALPGTFPKIPGFSAFSLDTIPTGGRPSGGLLIAVRNSIPWIPSQYLEITVEDSLYRSALHQEIRHCQPFY